MVSERDYDAASDHYADPAVPARGRGPALTGDEAAAAGRAFLIGEYGSEEALEQVIRRGRPRLGSGARGASASVRTRLSDADYAAFQRLAGETGKTQSELVREGVQLLLAQREAAD